MTFGNNICPLTVIKFQSFDVQILMSLMSIFGNNEKGINYLSIFKLSVQYLRQNYSVETKFNTIVIKNYYAAIMCQKRYKAIC